MKSNQFQCAHCEEIRTADRYIPDNQRIKIVVCQICLTEERDRQIANAARKNAVNPDYAPRSGNSPSKTVSVRQGDRKIIRETNEHAAESWENFKKSYRSIDLSITTQSAFLPEAEIDPEIALKSPTELDDEIKSTIAYLNQLRSARYHKSRRIAYEQHISYVQQMEEIRRRDKMERLKKNREAIGKKLRGASRRIYKRTGMLPNEFLQELMEKGIIPK